MLRIGSALVLLTSFVFGCARDEGPPSIAGKPAEEQAEIVTDVVCDHLAACGVVLVTCADCDGDDCLGCTVEHEAVDVDECVADMGPVYAMRFACEPPTDVQIATVDECLAALGELACPDLAAVEAWANEGEGEDPRELPPACIDAQRLGTSCEEEPLPGDDGVMPEPG